MRSLFYSIMWLSKSRFSSSINISSKCKFDLSYVAFNVAQILIRKICKTWLQATVLPSFGAEDSRRRTSRGSRPEGEACRMMRYNQIDVVIRINRSQK